MPLHEERDEDERQDDAWEGEGEAVEHGRTSGIDAERGMRDPPFDA
jgi:hypothetical protein